MLNYFKLSLHFLHIKIKRARTRRLHYFCFYFSDFKQTFSTLKVQTHETCQHQGEVQLQPEAEERHHSPSQVTDSLERMLAGAGLMQGTTAPCNLPREACVGTLPCTAEEGTVLIFYLLESCTICSNRKSTMHQIWCYAEQRDMSPTTQNCCFKTQFCHFYSQH